MSRFTEKLEKVGQRAPAPMGFGAAARSDDSPRSILLLGTVTLRGLPRVSAVRRKLVDALLITLDSGDGSELKDNVDTLEGVIWGVSAASLDQERLAILKDAGCDFVVLDPSASAAVLNDEDLGKIMRVGKDLSEGAAAAIHDLPIDGALLTVDDLRLPLSVQDLMDIDSVRGMLGKPFTVDVPADLSTPELEIIRDVGTAALAVDVLSKGVRELAGRVDSLKPKRQSSGRREDLTPAVPQGASVDFLQGGDDDEDY